MSACEKGRVACAVVEAPPPRPIAPNAKTAKAELWINKRDVGFAPPAEMTPSGQKLVGTWVSEQPSGVSGGMMQGMVALDTGGKGLEGIVDAVQQDRRITTGCVWLELREGHRGFRNECAFINGQASALEQTDVLSGKKSPLGVAVTWYLDGEVLKLRSESDMVLHYSGPEGNGDMPIRHWELQLTKTDQGYEVVERAPEYGFVRKDEVSYETFGGFLD